jgi:prepilin-type N-terminal cleavage/methylation domain-containing protein
MGKSLRTLVVRVRDERGDRDTGMTLVELMWAMVIFAIVAAATVAGLATALQTTRLDRNRLAASSLAARELEIVRNTFTGSPSGPGTIAATTFVTDPDPLPAGTAGSPLLVDGVPYTVTRNVEWLPDGTGQSPCDGGSAVTYPSLAVQVTVTWPKMGNVQPVQSNTVLTPPKGTLNTNLGFVGVKVLNAAGGRVSGQTVTMTGPGGTYSDTTAADGCAVFSTSTPGTYTTAINQAGYVDFYGNQNSTKTVVVSAGTLQQIQVSYDRAATVTVTMSTQVGFSVPTSLPMLTLANTGLQPTGTKTVTPSAVTTTVSGLWPFSDGYTMWAGQCAQADPAASGGTRNPALIVAPGATATSGVALAPVTVTVKNVLGLPQIGATVVAYPVNTTGCATTENPLTLGATDATGTLLTSLPAGAWKLQVNGKSPSGSWPVTPVLLPTTLGTTVAVNTT